MNLCVEEKKGGKPPARFPPRCPDSSGEGPGKTASLYHTVWPGQPPGQSFSVSRTPAPSHLAATELTSIVSSAKTPVTVAVVPACLSNVSKTDLSLVCKM